MLLSVYTAWVQFLPFCVRPLTGLLPSTSEYGLCQHMALLPSLPQTNA